MKKQGLLIHRGDAVSWAELETIRNTDTEIRHHGSYYSSDQRYLEVAVEFRSLPHFCPWRHQKLNGKRKRK